MELNEQIKAQKNVELRKRIYRALQSMYKLFRSSPRDIATVDKYMNIWKPLTGNIEDVVMFPYDSKKGFMAEKKDAKHCLFALVTQMIRIWHLHCKLPEEDYTKALACRLNKIELVIKSWSTLQVRGSDVTGYYLKMPKEKK
ncbi:hypothetical protein LCGC14_2288340 [marine sediment metagenome]|uniref:Uncharacterized protein n=1 Tax=marine sediment metagenome TaxID=412755 RepID=A0A0F9F4I1_9ZZZZ